MKTSQPHPEPDTVQSHHRSRTPSRIAFPRPRLLALAVRAALMALPVLAISAAPSTAHAQGAAQTPVQALHDFDIAAGALSTALTRAASAAGAPLTADAALTAGKSAPALKGRMTLREALAQLLAVSGLEATRQDNGGWLLVRRPPPVPETETAPRAAVETVLPVVRVKAGGAKETATGPVNGYVAKRSATGTKTDSSIIEVPQAITVVGSEEIRDRDAVILEEVMRYTPGAATNQGSLENGRVDYILLRGFDASRRNLLLDGLRYKDNTNDAQLEPFGAERIEILRGPASVLYGQMEPGGVINAISKRPQMDAHREIGVEVGRWGRKQVTADFTGPVNDDGSMMYRLTALGRRSATTIDLSYDDRVYIAPAFTWRPSQETSLTLLSSHSRVKHSYSWPLNQLENPGSNGQISDRLNVSGSGAYFSRYQNSIGYIFEQSIGDDAKVRQVARYSDAINDRHEVWAMGLQSDETTLRRAGIYDRQESRILSIDTSVQRSFKSLGMDHVFVAGLDAQVSRYHWREEDPGEVTALNIYSPDYSVASVIGPDGYFGSNCCTYDETTKGRRVGVYAQDQIKLARWVGTVGGRFDRASSEYSYVDIDPSYNEQRSKVDRKMTGRVGLVYLFDSGLAPYASYATSFYPEDGRDADGNSLKPTEGKQMEAGIRYQPVGYAFTLSAAAFNLKKRNVVTPIIPGSSINRQIGEVTSRGLELEIRAEPARVWSVIANLTYLDNKITKSNAGDQGWRQVNVPRYSFSTWNKLNFGGDLQGASMAMGIRYVGQSRSGWDSNNSHFNPASTLVDGSLGFDDGFKRYALSVHNLTNRRHLIDCDGTWCSKSIGRDVRVSVDFRF